MFIHFFEIFSSNKFTDILLLSIFKLAYSIDSIDKRPEYRRARLVWKNEGSESDNVIPLAECIAGSHCSSRLLSTASANLLVELPPRTVLFIPPNTNKVFNFRKLANV